MTLINTMPAETAQAETEPIDRPMRRIFRSGRIVFGGGILLIIALICLCSLPITLNPNSAFYYDQQNKDLVRLAPAMKHAAQWFGMDDLGRSLFGRCLLGGTISLGIGFAAATISMILGVSVGLVAGYRGGWTDSALMRIVDILYGLPYILMVILLKIAFEPMLARIFNPAAANLVVLFSAIGLVSWLTMSRVVRGQVLSLRSQPFIEACRAMGLGETRIFFRHILPNLIGLVIVYATLTVPVAILEESFLSFLGVGIAPPMPTWGSLASAGLLPALNPLNHRWWMLFFPCILLAVTLLCLNFLGDGLRDLFDPKREAAKI
ncbi:MAG TPA: ABC transporter permease [Tepidisphaeraceae bacterium]|nr:ABC transporter permease [Tepidisphaeraceae bacterium]